MCVDAVASEFISWCSELDIAIDLGNCDNMKRHVFNQFIELSLRSINKGYQSGVAELSVSLLRRSSIDVFRYRLIYINLPLFFLSNKLQVSNTNDCSSTYRPVTRQEYSEDMCAHERTHSVDGRLTGCCQRTRPCRALPSDCEACCMNCAASWTYCLLTTFVC